LAQNPQNRRLDRIFAAVGHGVRDGNVGHVTDRGQRRSHFLKSMATLVQCHKSVSKTTSPHPQILSHTGPAPQLIAYTSQGPPIVVHTSPEPQIVGHGGLAQKSPT